LFEVDFQEPSGEDSEVKSSTAEEMCCLCVEIGVFEEESNIGELRILGDVDEFEETSENHVALILAEDEFSVGQKNFEKSC